MTILEKLSFIKEERYQDLNKWQQGFIDDLTEKIDLHPDEVTEDEVRDFFSRRQIEKLDEIWQEIGL